MLILFFLSFFGIMFNLKGLQGQNPRTTCGPRTTVWDTLPYGISRKSTVWKIRTSAFLSHSVSWKRTFSKVSRVTSPYGQVHAKMHCVHWTVVLWNFYSYDTAYVVTYWRIIHVLQKYPGLWPPYTKFKRNAPCMLTCWYVLLSFYGFRYIVRRRKVILLGGSVHVNTALYKLFLDFHEIHCGGLFTKVFGASATFLKVAQWHSHLCSGVACPYSPLWSSG